MPNICKNRLEISGKAANVSRFKRRVRGRGTALSLNKLLRMPPFLILIKPGSNLPNWYDWRVDNWGTKWDVKAKIVSESSERIVYKFDSAWEPPMAWLKKAAATYPDLKFRLAYEDDGKNYKGDIIIKKHTVTEFDRYDLIISLSNFWRNGKNAASRIYHFYCG